jgi:hypothetical protein
MSIGRGTQTAEFAGQAGDPTLAAMRKAFKNLTLHFTLEELVFSSLAVRLQLDDTPSREVLERLKTLAMGLEQSALSSRGSNDRLGLPLHFVELPGSWRGPLRLKADSFGGLLYGLPPYVNFPYAPSEIATPVYCVHAPIYGEDAPAAG